MKSLHPRYKFYSRVDEVDMDGIEKLSDDEEMSECIIYVADTKTGIVLYNDATCRWMLWYNSYEEIKDDTSYQEHKSNSTLNDLSFKSALTSAIYSKEKFNITYGNSFYDGIKAMDEYLIMLSKPGNPKAATRRKRNPKLTSLRFTKNTMKDQNQLKLDGFLK